MNDIQVAFTQILMLLWIHILLLMDFVKNQMHNNKKNVPNLMQISEILAVLRIFYRLHWGKNQ